MIAGARSLYQSVEQALNSNPQLQAFAHNSKALQYDLEQSRSAYLPTVDLLLGYGLEQYSDDVTRRAGAEPSNTDWDSLGDSSLRLTQKVYDGGETGSRVSIQKALLDSANYQLQAATQTIALDAVIAHLSVFWRRELVSLAEKNLKIHRDIHRSLSEREQAGVGSIADVDQVQARLAHAESTLYLSQATLSQAIANYTRVICAPPGELAYAGLPEALPRTLEEALQRTEQGNPELRALDAEVVEADSRLALARSNYKPRIDLELSSRYNDNLEGDESWQNTNAAILYLRWNLFSGGGDKAGVNAALSRKHQSRSGRAAKLDEVTEATSTAWADYLSLQRQKASYGDAVDYGKKTFDAYLKQFSVSQRSLLDVLIAENDYFQSAVQLVSTEMNETIAAYRILALAGALQVPHDSAIPEYPKDYKHLKEKLIFPSVTQLISSASKIPSYVPAPSPVQEVIPSREPDISDNSAQSKETAASHEIKSTSLYTVEIGPCISRHELNQATKVLRNHGFTPREISGSGPVKMVRLREGVYPHDEALRQLALLKKTVDSAFLLPERGQLGLYAGSFHDSERAVRFLKVLEQKQIKVTAVAVEIEMQGRMLVIQQVDRPTAETIAEQMSRLGLTAKVTASDPI